MIRSMSEGVRPTKAVLEQLSIDVPPIPDFLHLIAHPIVVKAQSLPDEVHAGGAQRVLTLVDRVWFKAKRGRWRAACTELREPELSVMRIAHSWWIGAAGTRSSGSRDDFYEQLSSWSRDSSSLLPGTWDEKRLVAEAVTLAVIASQRAVRVAVAEALTSGEIVVLRLSERDVRIRVRVLPDGEAYLAISFVNTIETEFITTVLSSVDGVPSDDWQPEPTSPLHLTLEPGEMIFSTLLSTEAQATLIDP